MRISRVLLAATDNPLYWQFWNPISRIYKQNFGINPTLVWLGKESDIERLQLSEEWGNIIVQAPHPKFHIGWQSAWAIFWFMKKYQDDVFCTMGIDQVPLSHMLLREVPHDFYFTLADDAYLTSTWEKEGGTSPTSFHIVKGSTACKVYGFEDDFHSEIYKVANSGIIPYYNPLDGWGLDESYSSQKLREYRANGGQVYSASSFKLICDHRIECCRDNETPYDEEKLKSGWYGDAHLCRPYSRHRPYIDKLLSLIPK